MICFGIVSATSTDIGAFEFQTVTISSGCSSPGFGPATNIGVGTLPQDVAVGDFNLDTRPDLVSANFHSNNISVILNDGSGGFLAPTTISVGTNPASVAVGDFDLNGRPDIAVTNFGNSNVWVFLNNPAGGFFAPVSYSAGGGAFSVVVSDINFDTKPDLVCGIFAPGAFTVLLNNGSGGFGSPTSFATGSTTQAAVVGDFNTDGKPDVAAIKEGSSQVRVFVNTSMMGGAPSFTSLPDINVGTHPNNGAVADINLDGKPDILTSNGTGDNVSVLLNTSTIGGAVSFAAPVNFSMGDVPFSVAVSDFNLDGKPDMVSANAASSDLLVRLGDGAGGFGAITGFVPSPGGQAFYVTVGDFNTDSRPDLATTNQHSNVVSVLLNTCPASPPPPNTAPTINAVGVTRTAGSPSANSTIANVSDAEDAENTLAVTVNNSSSATVNGVTVNNITVDVAGVVNADVIAACGATNASFTLKVTDSFGLNTSATLNVTVNPNTPPTLMYSDQSTAFNGSLTAPPLVASDNGSITIFTIESVTPPLMIAPTVSALGVVSITTPQPAGNHVITVRAADNCGAITDASFTLSVGNPLPALGNYPNTTVSLSGNTTVIPDAAPAMSTGMTVSTSTKFKGTFTADPMTGIVRVTNAYPAGIYTVTVNGLNADGTANKNFTLTVEGGTPCADPTMFVNAPNVSIRSHPLSMAIGDFNNDGHQDFVTGYDSFDPLSIRLGDGAGNFSPAADVPTDPFVRGIAVGDFNGDGNMDLAAASYGFHTVSIRLGDGAGNFTGTTNISVGIQPWSIAVGDFNEDGNIDIAVSIYNTGNTTTGNVSILFGDGAGNFTGAADIPVVPNPISIVVGDFNNDGNQDFAAASETLAIVSVRLGNGAGGFTNAANINLPINSRWLVTGDFNNDGKQDIAVASEIGNIVSIRLGDGAGNFTSAPDIITNSGSVETGDFNNDSNQDLAIGNLFTGSPGIVLIRLGNGTGNFTAAADVNVSANPRIVLVGDFNSDGKHDLVVVHYTNANFAAIRLNNSCPPPNTPPTITAAAPLTRQQAAAAINSQIATVNDVDQTENTLMVTATPLTGTGVTVSNIIVAANGTVTADVAAGCAATNSTFTLTVKDNQNATATATLTVNVTAETTPPTISCPSNITQSTNPDQCSAVVNFTTPTANDNCPGAMVVCNPATGATFPKGVTTVTCTATDAVGNTASCTFTVTIADSQAPTIACPSPITQGTDANQCSAVVSYTTPSASDNCSGVGAVTCSPASGSTFPKGTTTVTCSVTDASDNNGSCSFTVTINDTQPPQITCPASVTTSNDPNQCSAVVNYTNATATDNCPGVGAVGCSPASGSTFPKGITTVTCSVTDASQNTSTCSFTVTVNDTQQPVITCPGNVTQATDAGVCSAVVNYSTPSVSDNCSGAGTPVCTPAAGSTFPKGTTTVNCSVSDASSNQVNCSFTVTINDTQPPTITCPASISQETDPGLCSAVVGYATPTASDNCGSASVVCNPISGATFAKGITTVTCTATDTSNNTASCSFMVTVNDTQPPSVTCPANLMANNDSGQCSAIVNYTAPTPTDNCPGATVLCSPSSGSTFPKGTTSVTCTATDSSGNTGACSFTVTVNDTQSPTIACPSNIVTGNDQGQCSAIINYTTPTASDNCSGVGAVTCSPASGSTFPKGTTSVTCTVTDASGNTSSCSFTVTVNDMQAPTVTCPASIVKATDPNQCSALVTFSATASDNCPGATASCNPPSGSTFAKGVTTVSCSATDASGNQSATCSFSVTVNDTQSPSIACPANITKATDPNLCSAVAAYSAPSVSDNCPGVGAPVCNPPTGSTFPKGVTTVSCAVMDASSNQSYCSFTVTVNDTQLPAIICPPTQVRALARATDTTVLVTYPAPVFSDNCPGAGIVCNPPSGSAFPVGTTTVTCTVTDGAGNQSGCNFIVTTYDICLQDDGNAATVILFNSFTGDYLFCCDGTTFTGRGVVQKQGSIYTLTHNTTSRRVSARFDGTQNKGTASLQSPIGTTRCSITDRDTRNNSCLCAPSGQ